MTATEFPKEQVPEEEQDTTVSDSEETSGIPAPTEDTAANSFEGETDAVDPKEQEEPFSDQPAEEKTDDEGDGRAWYVVHCYSGYENKVRHNLEQRIESMDMQDKIFDVVIPTQEEIEVRDGKRRSIERHVFPGYVLVNMKMSEDSWYVVRNTPGVTGFVGMGNDPVPLRPEEVSQILRRMEAEAPTIKVTYKPGERVRIIDGPFNDFPGVVDEIDMDRSKVRVMVNFFGRSTPVELDFLQVEKM
jgi:transcriptional antiterminator NusG